MIEIRVTCACGRAHHVHAGELGTPERDELLREGPQSVATVIPLNDPGDTEDTRQALVEHFRKRERALKAQIAYLERFAKPEIAQEAFAHARIALVAEDEAEHSEASEATDG